jgi:hypothetical protein
MTTASSAYRAAMAAASWPRAAEGRARRAPHRIGTSERMVLPPL